MEKNKHYWIQWKKKPQKFNSKIFGFAFRIFLFTFHIFYLLFSWSISCGVNECNRYVSIKKILRWNFYRRHEKYNFFLSFLRIPYKFWIIQWNLIDFLKGNVQHGLTNFFSIEYSKYSGLLGLINWMNDIIFYFILQ